MAGVKVQNIDLFSHPFYKLSRESGSRQLSAQERKFLDFLEAKWKKAILLAKRKKDNLFVLIDYPLANPEAQQSFDRIEAFARSTLGKRFRLVSFSLSQHKRVQGRAKVSLSAWPFAGVHFSKDKPIKITSWGESLGTCPVNEANALKASLKEAGLRVSIAMKDRLSVKEHVSIQANLRRMKKRPIQRRRK